jgi:hypothetical protein
MKKGHTVSPETRAKMKEAAKRRWAERKVREQEVIEKEQALENYHKGNVIPIKTAVPKPSSEPILLSFETDPAIHKEIIEEATREGRSVPAHLSWLMRCLYDPPVQTSAQRVRELTMREIAGRLT